MRTPSTKEKKRPISNLQKLIKLFKYRMEVMGIYYRDIIDVESNFDEILFKDKDTGIKYVVSIEEIPE